jgi:hypothetical protein
MIKPTVLCAALLTTAFSYAADPKPYIGEDLQLRVNGKAFFVRGMAYAPEPLGFPANAMQTKSQYGWNYSQGAWLCGPANQYAANDWQSPCADDDLFGTLALTTPANGAYNAAIQAKWERDLDAMKKMGVNTLRLYNVNPDGKNHLPFLDAVAKRNMYVIYPALSNYLAREAPGGFKKELVQAIVSETCPGKVQHPAILAYTAGNEITPVENQEDASRIRQTMEIVKATCPGALVTYAHNDNPPDWVMANNQNGQSVLMEKFPLMDFLTVNIYRKNPNNGDIDAYYKLFYSDIKGVTEKYRKPFLIGETGEHQNDRFKPFWFNYEWQYVVANSTQVGNLGAVFFSYNDEPIKKSRSGTSNDVYMGIVSAGLAPLNKKDQAIDPPDRFKTADYQGIPDYTDGGYAIKHPGSEKGAGRYEMFVNDGKGIAGCSFVGAPSPAGIGACATAK